MPLSSAGGRAGSDYLKNKVGLVSMVLLVLSSCLAEAAKNEGDATGRTVLLAREYVITGSTVDTVSHFVVGHRFLA